jgi:GntR family transcriptional regulator/MocR family aminotransferase
LVKHAAGVLLPAPAPSLRGGDRRQRVYRTIVDAVASGRLAAGARLPSSRRLAEDWALARGVVDEAYARLQDEGVIVRRVGDGSYVAWAPPSRPPSPLAGGGRPDRPAPGPIELATGALRQSAGGPCPGLVLDPCRAPVEEFPLDSWRRLVARALGDGQRALLDHAPAAGLPALREALARHLALTRSLPCGADQVLVLDSPSRGLELVARALLEAGDRVCIEAPGPPGRREQLRALQLEPVEVAVCARGVELPAAGRGADARLAWLHPLWRGLLPPASAAGAELPPGGRLDACRAQALALSQWAHETKAWVLEAAQDDELVHQGPTPPAWAAHDRHGRTLLLGSFDHLFCPALRLAYLVVPPALAPALGQRLAQRAEPPPAPTQRALAWFIDEGHCTSHLRRLRRRVSERRAVLLQAAQRHLRDAQGLPLPVRFGPLDAGLHAWLHLPPAWPDQLVRQRLLPLGVGAQAASASGHSGGAQGRATDFNALQLGYGACAAADIEAGMASLGSVLRTLAQHAGEPAQQFAPA